MMTVGYFSPLPPLRTGVAEYAAGLLEGLRRRGGVHVSDRRASVRLYHIGNNHLHREIYAEALAHPGVVVLHDAVLQHFLLGQLSLEEYIDEFVYNYGTWTTDLARQMYLERAHSGIDARYFQFPLLKRLVERSRAVIVHNPGAAAAVLAHVPDARVFEIPHFFVRPAEMPLSDDVRMLRRGEGVSPGGTLFGVFGHLRETKRLSAVIRAFQCVHATHPETRLLLAGEPASRDVQRLLANLQNEPGILMRGYLPERQFWEYAAAVDACINLRFPTAGETSGIGVRLMGIGKPVIFTDGPEIQTYPPEVCLRVDSGRSEEDLLTAYLLWLTEFPMDAQAVGWAAEAHIAAHHDLEKISAEFWRVLGSVAD